MYACAQLAAIHDETTLMPMTYNALSVTWEARCLAGRSNRAVRARVIRSATNTFLGRGYRISIMIHHQREPYAHAEDTDQRGPRVGRFCGHDRLIRIEKTVQSISPGGRSAIRDDRSTHWYCGCVRLQLLATLTGLPRLAVQVRTASGWGGKL